MHASSWNDRGCRKVSYSYPTQIHILCLSMVQRSTTPQTTGSESFSLVISWSENATKKTFLDPPKSLDVTKWLDVSPEFEKAHTIGMTWKTWKSWRLTKAEIRLTKRGTCTSSWRKIQNIIISHYFNLQMMIQATNCLHWNRLVAISPLFLEPQLASGRSRFQWKLYTRMSKIIDKQRAQIIWRKWKSQLWSRSKRKLG